MGRVYRNLTLMDSGLVVAGWTGYDGHFMGMLFEVWMRLVPRNTSTKYK